MHENLKALILAGGRGKRLGDVSAVTSKCMLTLGDRPLISYSLDCAVDAGVSEIVIVVGYRAGDIINHYGIEYKGCRIQYALQQEQKGLVHAIETAAEKLEKKDFMTFLADEVLIHPRHCEMVKFFYQNNLYAVCGVVHTDHPDEISKTYAVMQDQNDRILRLIEKPPKPINNIQGTGNCIFKNEILGYTQFTPVSHQRGEKEFPDLIQCAIDRGHEVRSFDIGARYININAEDDIDHFRDVIG